MATAILTGMHNVAANWDTGVVPVAPEPIVIPNGIVITQASAWSVGDGLGVTPAITIDIGGELVVSADTLTANGHVTLNGTLTHDFASTLLFAGGNWQITQSSGAVWRTSAGSGVWPVVTADVGQHWLWRSGLFDAPVVAVDGIELRRCGTSAVNGVECGGHNQAAFSVQFKRFLWADCGRMRLGVGATHHVDAICVVDTPIIVRPLSTANISIEYAANFPANWVGDRGIRNVYANGLTPTALMSAVRVGSKNAVTNTTFDLHFACGIDAVPDNFAGGNVTISGALCNDVYSGTGSQVSATINASAWHITDLLMYSAMPNMHFVASGFTVAGVGTSTFTNALVDCESIGGANVVPYKDGGLRVANVVVLGANTVYSTSANNIGDGLVYERCTQVASTLDQQVAMLQETNQGSGTYPAIGRSNIRVNTHTANGVFADVLPGGGNPIQADQFTWLDNNNHYTPALTAPYDPYPNIAITGLVKGTVGFGSADLFVDPQFVGGTQNLAAFDVQQGGVGIAVNVFYEAFKRSGYDKDGVAAVWDANYDLTTAKAQIMASYTPQNAALQGAAHDGGDIGAIAVVPLVDLTAPVITLLGDAVVTLLRGETYVDAGATAVDDTDGDLTAAIVAVNAVDTSVVGVYAITYNVVDAAGNPATQVTRTVNISTTSSYKQQTSFTGGING